MAIITSKQLVLPTRIYRWQKYSVVTTTVTEKSWSTNPAVSAWNSYIDDDTQPLVYSGLGVSASSSAGWSSSVDHELGKSSTLTTTVTKGAGTYYVKAYAVYDDGWEPDE